MHSAAFRSAIVLFLLAGALLAVYAPSWPDLSSTRSGLADASFTYVPDIDYWRRTEREQWVQTTVPFDLAHDLNHVPLQLGDWLGEDVPETNVEVFMLLEPEQYVQRRYRDKAGHSLWLTMVRGRNSRSFHPPDLCYEADGWQVSMSSRAIAMEGGGEMYGLWLEAQKQESGEAAPTEHKIFYFYLFPDGERDQTDGLVLFKLTSPGSASVEEALALQGDFLRQLFSRTEPIR